MTDVADDNSEVQEVEVVYSREQPRLASVITKMHTRDGDPFGNKLEDVRKMDGLSQRSKYNLTRAITKRLEGQGDTGTKGTTWERENAYGVFEVVPPLYNMEYLAKLYEINPTHKAAVDAKVSNTVGLGYTWHETLQLQETFSDLVNSESFDELENKRRNAKRLENRLTDWLDGLNQEDDFLTTLSNAMVDLETTGMAYIEIGRKNNGQVGYVGHIPSHTMRIRKERDGFVQIVGAKVAFFRNFGDRDTEDPIGDDPEPNEIIVFKKYSPRSNYYGVPDIISAMSAVAGSEFARRFNLDYFEHKAVPRYIILVKGARLSEESEKKLVNFFQTNLKGQNHRTVYIPLPGDTDGNKVEFEIVPVEAKMQDASFMKYAEMNRDEILMAHRVPMTKVGLSADVGLAVAKDADKMFKEQVTRPMQRKIESKLKPFFAEKSNAFYFKLNELTLTDEETQSKIDERYVRTGIVLRNEVRERMGRKGVEGGDRPVEALESDPDVGADQRSQARAGRDREQEQGNGSNNTDSQRNANGEGRVDAE